MKRALIAEAVVRGHKAGLLTTSDYNNLCQCETLDDVKLHLVSFLARHTCLEHVVLLPRPGYNPVTYKAWNVTMQTSTDYGPYLASEASPLHTTTIVERCTEKLVDDWNKMRANVRSPYPTLPIYCFATPFSLSNLCPLLFHW